MPKLQTLAYKRYKKFQDAIQTRPARMGRNDETVVASTSGYMIWVTYFDGTQEKILNQRIPNYTNGVCQTAVGAIRNA